MESEKSRKLKFRPQGWPRREVIRCYRENGHCIGIYNWYTRSSVDDYLIESPKIYKIGSHLHYLACHAPKNIRAKWNSAWRRFYKNYPKF